MTGPEALYAQLTSGNPGTIATVRDSVNESMTSIDESADSLVMATTGVEWKGQDRDSYNERIWGTKAMAEMAHLRCSQDKMALRSVRAAYVAMKKDADLVITVWRRNKALSIDGPTLNPLITSAVLSSTVAPCGSPPGPRRGRPATPCTI